MSQLVRTYHGCKVVSELAPPIKAGETPKHDGWNHEVFTTDGISLGKCATLGEAIGVARSQAEVSKEPGDMPAEGEE